MDLNSLLSTLLPRAIAWAEQQQQDILRTGRTLTAEELETARAIGVHEPARIRVKTVSVIPLPEDPILIQAARQAGFGGPDMIGLTLFYGIFICEGGYTRSLFAHECHHVTQYEQRGSIERFLKEYLPQVLTKGYNNAPLEEEARFAAMRYELTLKR